MTDPGHTIEVLRHALGLLSETYPILLQLFNSLHPPTLEGILRYDRHKRPRANEREEGGEEEEDVPPAKRVCRQDAAAVFKHFTHS